MKLIQSFLKFFAIYLNIKPMPNDRCRIFFLNIQRLQKRKIFFFWFKEITATVDFMVLTFWTFFFYFLIHFAINRMKGRLKILLWQLWKIWLNLKLFLVNMKLMKCHQMPYILRAISWKSKIIYGWNTFDNNKIPAPSWKHLILKFEFVWLNWTNTSPNSTMIRAVSLFLGLTYFW